MELKKASHRDLIKNDANVTVELIWLQSLLCKIHLLLWTAPLLWYNVFVSPTWMHPIFQTGTEHEEINYHFVCEQVNNNLRSPSSPPSTSLWMLSPSLYPSSAFTRSRTSFMLFHQLWLHNVTQEPLRVQWLFSNVYKSGVSNCVNEVFLLSEIP